MHVTYLVRLAGRSLSGVLGRLGGAMIVLEAFTLGCSLEILRCTRYWNTEENIRKKALVFKINEIERLRGCEVDL